jgi:hypothetical protein
VALYEYMHVMWMHAMSLNLERRYNDGGRHSCELNDVILCVKPLTALCDGYAYVHTCINMYIYT